MDYKFCVIGNPIAHSKSPLIHHEFARQFQLLIEYERVLAPVDQFDKAINELKAKNLIGCNITLPFKEQAYIVANIHSERASRAKAVNTFKFQADGLIYADNTDGLGLVRDIQENIGYPLKSKRILICGAGGAARGVLYPIVEQQPVSLAIVNRTKEKAINLANEFSDILMIKGLSYPELAGQEFDVIIDATSFANEDLSIPDSLAISHDSLCYDLKYLPNNEATVLMKWAKSIGCKNTHDGLGMLVEQAAESFRLWTGHMPDPRPVINKLKNHEI